MMAIYSDIDHLRVRLFLAMFVVCSSLFWVEAVDEKETQNIEN